MHSRDEQRASSGAGPAATDVEPGASAAPEPPHQSGETAVPLGTPADDEEWRELKRRADEPDESGEQDPPSAGD